MRKGNLTREEAIKIAGEAAVNAVETENCDFTNRVGYNGSCQGDSEVEFSAAVKCADADGDEATLVVYYYQSAEAVDSAQELGDLDWQVEGYEIV